MPIREEVERLATYRPGGRQQQGAPLINLAANENPFGPSAAVSQALAEAGAVNRYPPMQAGELVAKLAARHDLPAEQIVLGTGSGHLIKLLAEVLVRPGDRVAIPHPGFSLYRHGVVLMGGEPLAVDVTGDDAGAAGYRQAAAGASFGFVCSPHNPLGHAIDAAAIADFAKALPAGGVAVVDEAYIEFSDRESAISLLRAGLPVAVLRTFSKVYGLAALRVGWLAAPAWLAQAVRRVSEPFPVNVVASRAAGAALDDQEYVAQVVRRTRHERTRLRDGLHALGLGVLHSQSNFLLVQVGERASALFDHLQSRGILVRRTESFGLPGCLRITVGTEDENGSLLAAAADFMQ